MKRFLATISIAAMQVAFAAHAFAQSINVALAPQEVVAIVQSMDRQPLSEAPPAGFWDAEGKILEALKANPEAWRKVRAALEEHYKVR
jgi:hypothetical protein